MSVSMQWNLPHDFARVDYVADAIGDSFGVRMSRTGNAWSGEHLVVYGTREQLAGWHARIGEVIAALPDPEPRFEYADLPVHDGLEP